MLDQLNCEATRWEFPCSEMMWSIYDFHILYKAIASGNVLIYKSDNCIEQRSDWSVEWLNAVGFPFAPLLACKQGNSLLLIAPRRSRIGFWRINELFCFSVAEGLKHLISTNVTWVRFRSRRLIRVEFVGSLFCSEIFFCVPLFSLPSFVLSSSSSSPSIRYVIIIVFTIFI